MKLFLLWQPVLDLAGPGYKYNNCTKLTQFHYGGETVGVAQNVVVAYTDPCGFGNGNFSTGNSNLRIDPQNGFNHPGNQTLKSILNPFTKHSYATFITASMCLGTPVYAYGDTNRQYNLNPFFNDVPRGLFDVPSIGCWPFFCYYWI